MWPLAGCISSCIVRTPSSQLGVLQSIRGSSLSSSVPSSHLAHTTLGRQSKESLLFSSLTPLQRPMLGIRRTSLHFPWLRDCKSRPGRHPALHLILFVQQSDALVQQGSWPLCVHAHLTIFYANHVQPLRASTTRAVQVLHQVLEVRRVLQVERPALQLVARCRS